MLAEGGPQLIEVNEMPKTGQFVAVWIYDNLPWSTTYAWDGANLFQYVEEDEAFEVVPQRVFESILEYKPRFFVVHE